MSGIVAPILRKFGHVKRDPILRRWLFDRLMGREASTDFTRRRPNYLDGCELNTRETVDVPWPDLQFLPPTHNLELDLPGERIVLRPGQEIALFAQAFADTETLLALHRFAWLPTTDADPAWTGSLWRAWLERFGEQDDVWAWHPYTAAERLINISGFSERFGLPGPRAATLRAFARHGAEILNRLEYYGEGSPGNHLANNGRGLFLGGLALGLPDWVDIGARILVHEAARIFAPSGILREGSAHYHLLVSRWYVLAWYAARRNGRSESEALGKIARRALSVIPQLLLPGGLPLIGDVSPDMSPAAIVQWANGIEHGVASVSRDDLRRDGWLRFDEGDWHLLAHASPSGWPPMPGHGHLDFGSFELHHGVTPIFCDLGRRSYGAQGDADVAAASHNTILVDGMSAYPENRPYYSDGFRYRVGGPPPIISCDGTTIKIVSSGFARVRGLGDWHRILRFQKDRLMIEDSIDGTGEHMIARHFHTTLPVSRGDDGIRLGAWRVISPTSINLEPVSYWSAYGAAVPATSLLLREKVTLPWSGHVSVTTS